MLTAVEQERVKKVYLTKAKPYPIDKKTQIMIQAVKKV